MKNYIYLLLLALTLNLHASEKSIVYTNYYGDGITSKYTDWTNRIFVPQFNPAIGKLKDVKLQASIIENRTIRFENLNAMRQVFTARLTNTFGIIAPQYTNEFKTIFSVVKNMQSFDGIVDFSGASGYITNKITTNNIALNAGNTNIYAGYSIIPITVSVRGRSYANFPGGAAASYFSDIVGAIIYVQYTYEDNCLICGKEDENDEKDCEKDDKEYYHNFHHEKDDDCEDDDKEGDHKESQNEK